MEKAMFEIEELSNDDLFSEEDFNCNSEYFYEVWAIGYTGDNMITDAEVLLRT